MVCLIDRRSLMLGAGLSPPALRGAGPWLSYTPDAAPALARVSTRLVHYRQSNKTTQDI